MRSPGNPVSGHGCVNRWTRMWRQYLLFVCLLAGLIACTNNKADQLYPTARCAADTMVTISFVRDVQPIFQAGCVAGCHTGGSPQGHLSLDSAVAYAELWRSGTGNIDTLNPTASLLYSSMVSATSPMPPSGKLDDCKLKLVLKWLQQKAQNN